VVAALVAAVGMGIYPDFESLKKVVKVDSVYEPQPGNSEIYDSLVSPLSRGLPNLTPERRRFKSWRR
jgi:sugar (pentulose or hexulose) kinase